MADIPAEIAVLENPSGSFPALIICEHASHHIPERFSNLGLAGPALTAHIAWDPGALEVARALSAQLNAPLVHATVSRLVLDLNREPSAPDSITTISENTPVPGNVALDDNERKRRVREIYEPFHQAADALVERRLSEKSIKAVISIHSFTPVFKGQSRPWHLGFIHDKDDRLARAVLRDLSADPALVMALNEPYNTSHGVFHTLDRHAVQRGLAPLMVEVRNDLIAARDTQDAMADRLAGAIEKAVGNL